MLELYIIRHGKTEFNKKKLIIGLSDSRLLPSAVKNTKKLSARLKKIKFDAIISSDLGRAFNTACIISYKLGGKVKLKKSKKLREIDYGILTGKSKKIMGKKYPKYHKDVQYVHPKGESFQQVYDRVVPFVKSLENKYNRVLLVTHGGCMRAIYSFFKKEKFQNNINMKIKHTMIMKCVLKNRKPLGIRLLDY